MTDNIYTEHATTTELLGRERIKNRGLTILLKIMGFAWLIMFCSWLLMFAIGFRADRFFYSDCVSYPKLPIIKPIPIQK